ncbi:MAG: S-methyl-5-thioribose kinase, partial [Gammaproteobacteria bacterium]
TDIFDHSIVIKQSLPFLKCIGPEAPLPVERIKYEVSYAKAMSKIKLRTSVYNPSLFLTPNDKATCNEFIPQLQYVDINNMWLMIMTDLKQHHILRDGLVKKNKYPVFSKHIATYLANALFKTSQYHLDEIKFQKLTVKFQSNRLCKLTEDFVFIFPYTKHDTNYHTTARPTSFNKNFMENASELLKHFNEHHEALVHGDLHTGSIMLNNDQTFIIDHEFAFVGPMGFDLGLLLANLITAWVHHVVVSQDMVYQAWLLECITAIFNDFNNQFQKIYRTHSLNLTAETDSTLPEFLTKVFHDSVGFAGLEICRRVCGIAGVSEIRQIKDEEIKLKAETLAVNIGQYLVENYNALSNIESVVQYVASYNNQTINPLAILAHAQI